MYSPVRFSLFLLMFCTLFTAACTARGSAHAGFLAKEGGVLVTGLSVDRAERGLDRLRSEATCTTRCHLRIQVLKTKAFVAYSFPDGEIYVADGLICRLSDNELAACIAHEMGHMLRDGTLQAPAALNGAEPWGRDVERAADLLGTRILEASHVPVNALPAALEKVAADARGTACYAALCERARYLRSLQLPR